MKVKVTGYVHHVQYPWDEKASYAFFSSVMDQVDYYTCVSQVPVEIEVEIPDNFDPRPKQIAALEEKKRKVQAEFAKRVAEIDDQISKYLAIAA